MLQHLKQFNSEKYEIESIVALKDIIEVPPHSNVILCIQSFNLLKGFGGKSLKEIICEYDYRMQMCPLLTDKRPGATASHQSMVMTFQISIINSQKINNIGKYTRVRNFKTFLTSSSAECSDVSVENFDNIGTDALVTRPVIDGDFSDLCWKCCGWSHHCHHCRQLLEFFSLDPNSVSVPPSPSCLRPSVNYK